MIRRAAAPLFGALALTLALASVALAVTYRGAGVEDGQMPVRLERTGELIEFEYEDVLVECSDGSTPRQGGASHLDNLNEHGRFKDRFELDDTTSVVRGKVHKRKATGTISYDLDYAGGECHSGEVEWKARRK